MTDEQIEQCLRTHLDHGEEFGDVIGNILDEIPETADHCIHRSHVRILIKIALKAGQDHVADIVGYRE